MIVRLYHDQLINNETLTRSVGVISSSWFLLGLLPSPGFKTMGDKTRRALLLTK